MASIAATRTALAAALNTISGLNVRPRPTVKNPKISDGWIIVGRVEPAVQSMNRCSVTFTAVVVLGADEARAETRMEELSVALVNAVTQSPTLAPDDVFLEPVLLPVGDVSPTPLYALTINCNLEVD
jgi:hypothetical protein